MRRTYRTPSRLRPTIRTAMVFSVAACGYGTCVPAARAWAQASTPVPSDTANALVIEPVRTLRFTTDEGTWISLDVSPDGERIVFDLLGDLYVIPISGGKATRLTSGTPWDGMPRWSPDGSRIAFISDRDGADNLWFVAPDGTGLRRRTSEVTNTLSSPAWSPDGRYLVVRRFGPYPTEENYLTNVPLWMYHVDGGAGTQIYPASTSVKSTNTGAAFSSDGRRLYLSTHAGGYSGENVGAYQVVEYDLADGAERKLTAGAGGGLRPITSPDGRWLVYATRTGARTALRIRDLTTHEDSWLVPHVQRDDQEGYAPNDVFPGYAFTPDSRSVVFYAGGKIERVDVASREVSVIPFSVDVELGMGARHFLPLEVDDGPVRVTQLLSPTEAPEGDALAFSAVGRVWVAGVEGERVDPPVRLTGWEEGNGPAREYYPAYSPDGRWIAFVTWSDAEGGYLWKARADGSGRPVRLTTEPAYVRWPRWSPEGDRIVFGWAPRQAGLGSGPVASVDELRWISADGGAPGVITRTASQVAGITGGGDEEGRVYFSEPTPRRGFTATTVTRLVSTRFDGADRRVHLSLTTAQVSPPVLEISPDEGHVLLLDRDDAYVLPLTPAGADGLAVNLSSPSVPLRRLTDEGANYVAWAEGGATLTWSLSQHQYRAPLASVMASTDRNAWGILHREVVLTAPRAVPSGDIVLMGARIVTMAGGGITSAPGGGDADGVIEEGAIWVRGNRIMEVGATVSAPADAHVVDVAGATIIPGLVDVHAHPKTGAEMAPDQEWSLASNLAYGVTTTRNPSGSRWNVAWGELVETGGMSGPRVWATGTPLTTNNAPVASYEDALRVVRRYKEQGAHSIKQYLQPRRIQRQWILQAAVAEGINVTNEGAADLRMDLSMAVDGFAAIEHSIGQVPLYKDAVTLLADARIAYTPTLVVAYGAPSGDTYFRARTDLDKDPKTAFFTPAELLAARARRRPMIVEEDYNFPDIARGVRDVVRAGGIAGLGSHGQQDGIAAHWELWMLQSGEMTNLEALRIATILGAESIGYAQDLGSLEPGKLADLLVLHDNPLDDIHASTSLRFVMKNGELFDASTLDRIWPSPRPFPTPHWVLEQERLEALAGR